MDVVLWDTREGNVSKEFAAGFGVGVYPGGGGLRGLIVRRFFTRDRRPVALLYAHLAAVFGRLGHRVRYAVDRLPAADLYVFCPSLGTLDRERRAMQSAARRNPHAAILVVGLVATVLPEAFEGLPVTVVKGEPEQLLWKLDEVLARPGAAVQLGVLEDLDRLPLPEWSPFGPRRFRVAYDFWKFPTALIQASRGCSLRCSYCPYTVLDNGTRFRDAGAVVEEIEQGIRRWGFRSFKFRDPLFGLNRRQVFRLAELIERLPRKIQFSVETRADLLTPEVLRVLKRVGLTSVTFGVETPNRRVLARCRRPVGDDRQRKFIADCRALGIRTVAGFMIGFPGDDAGSIKAVLNHALELGPTFANFNVVTPYPGTEFFQRVRGRIAEPDFTRYDVYTPVLRYDHLTAEQLRRLTATCFQRFYFRWDYLRRNAALLWPRLALLGLGRAERCRPAADAPHPAVPKPLSALELLERKGFRTDRPHRRDQAAPPPSADSRADG